MNHSLHTGADVHGLTLRGRSETLLTLAARLADVHRAVAARVPLHDRARVHELPAYLARAPTALEPR